MKNNLLLIVLPILLVACQSTAALETSTPTVPVSTPTLIPTNSPPPTDTPTVSPPARPEIVFSSDRDGDTEIYAMTADGNNIYQLTNNSTSDSNPKWSSDHSQILFQSDREGNSVPYLMNSDGSNQRPASPEIVNEYHLKAKWSPDSNLLGIWNENSLYIVQAADGGVLLQKPLAAVDISWSPAGDQIVFCSYSNGKYNISILSISDGKLKKITALDDTVQLISWSPDGNKIAVSASGDFGQLAKIFTMNTDGSQLTKLTDNNGPFWLSDWTPDGKHILSDGPRSPYLVSVDGAGTTQVSKLPEPNDPSFDTVEPNLSPDGTRIVFSYDSDGELEIFTVNLDGTELTNITNNPANDYNPDW
jgi:Tol biopolymer transport system component